MRPIILCLSFLFLFFSNSNAQTDGCGTAIPDAAMVANLLNQINQQQNQNQNIALMTLDNPTCLPVQIHIVRTDDGSFGFNPNFLAEAFADLNYAYRESGIQFFIRNDINFIDNSDFYTYDRTSPDNDNEDDFLTGEVASDAINLIIAGSLKLSSGSAAGFARYPANTARSNRIFMKNSAMLNGANGTLAHEFGHYLWLFHTHEGTEDGNTDSKAERVVRTGSNANCATKGDLLCDTDADPRYLGSQFNFSSCTYTGNAVDDLGVTYLPTTSIENIMSYYPTACVEGFSQGQYTRMELGLNERLSHTAYNLGYTPNFIAAPSNLIVDASLAGINKLTWTDNANNELGYIVERSSSSSSSGFRVVESGGVGPNVTTYSDSGFANNTTYWYRVRPVNASCDRYSNVVSNGSNNDCTENISGYNYLGEYNDSKYFISNNSSNWTSARTSATNAGGDLVAINSQAENSKIFNWINEIILIGLNDIQSEGTPKWSNGDAFTFNTINDQNTSDRDYGKMNNWNGNWGWDNNNANYRHVMEVPCDQGCTCPPTNAPVCGSNGVTYPNACEAECAGIFNYTNGSCNTGGDCPNSLSGFTTLGEFGDSKYYLSNSSAKPLDAQSTAVSLGGHVVTINSSGENNFIQQNISEMVYIGLSDKDSEGNLKWFNGEPLTYNNVDPCGFCESNSSSKDFVIMAPWNGTWSFSSEFNQRKYVVEIPCDGGGGTNKPDLTLSNLDNVASSMTPGAVEFFEFDLKNIGNATATNSYTIGMYISTDQNLSSSDILAGDLGTGNTFVGTDPNVPAAITVPSVSSGTYYLIVKADIGNAISESNENNNTISSGPITIGSGGNGGCNSSTNISGFTYIGEYSNSRYYFSNSSARPTDAQATCESNGGYLASITSAGENNFIQQGISGFTYIGFNDEDFEGSVRWYSGEPVGYTNFDICSFCNGNSSSQDYGVMTSWSGKWSWSNFWNKRKYVMEIPCNSGPPNPLISIPDLTKERLDFISVVPNPADQFIGVQLKSSHDTAVEIQIYDSRGVMVRSVQDQLFKGLNGIELDITELPEGMYWIRVPSVQRNHATKRFVKVRN